MAHPVLIEAILTLRKGLSRKRALIATAAIVLGETSATSLAGLKVGDVMVRLRGVLGGVKDMEAFTAGWSALDRDAPLVTARDGGVASRTTIWRMFRQIGHVAMRRMAAKVKAALVKAAPAAEGLKAAAVTWPNDPMKEAQLAFYRHLPPGRLRMMGLLPS